MPMTFIVLPIVAIVHGIASLVARNTWKEALKLKEENGDTLETILHDWVKIGGPNVGTLNYPKLKLTKEDITLYFLIEHNPERAEFAPFFLSALPTSDKYSLYEESYILIDSRLYHISKYFGLREIHFFCPNRIEALLSAIKKINLEEQGHIKLSKNQVNNLIGAHSYHYPATKYDTIFFKDLKNDTQQNKAMRALLRLNLFETTEELEWRDPTGLANFTKSC